MRERALQVGRARFVAAEVGLELVVVVRDDLLDDLVVQRVLLVADVGGDLLVVGPARPPARRRRTRGRAR
nr:hypothetical protein [Cellulosimicrobium sp. MM]